eukprot:TRINITY_DN16161_c0_g1_i5.p1 TRINITY_DN16161_c0_g1~~TRINITY_DN16161_c0_g1_i5.p1  ORF type:complete len:477 (-),score=185.16 TRINITY_DN16161_c0_g1_i5:127-1557(-)
MDALQALRQACIQGRVPKLKPEDTTVVLGDRGSPWSLDTRTSWRSKANEFYTLHALILLLQYADEPIGNYLRTATTWKVKFVSNVDRKELLAYLKGEIDASDAIQSSAVADKSVFAAQDSMPLKRQRAGEGDAGGLTEDQLRDAKQRHAERLGGPARARALIISDRMAGESELLEGMSSDKLLELRTKRLAQKRSTFSLEAGGEPGEEEAAVDPAFLDADRQMVAHIRAKEIRVLDRNSVLRRPGKDFKFAHDYYQEVRRKEKEMAKEKEDGTYGKKRSRGGGVAPDRDRSAAVASVSASVADPNAGPPIIVVPNLQSAVITLANAKEFFEEGRFVPANGVIRKPSVDRKSSDVLVERALPGGRHATYRLIDNPTRLRPREWESIVCVIVAGPAWQFKGWVWDQPVVLFQHALGVHLKFDDTRADGKVASWNVRVLDINKHKRYLDKGASLALWRMIDDFVHVHKPHMIKAVEARA